MAFDTSELDAACMADDFSDEAYWPPTNTDFIPVIFNIENEYETDEGYRVKVGDKITAGTLASNIAGMKRKDQIQILGNVYAVIGFEPDGNGWVDILLEKA